MQMLSCISRSKMGGHSSLPSLPVKCISAGQTGWSLTQDKHHECQLLSLRVASLPVYVFIFFKAFSNKSVGLWCCCGVSADSALRDSVTQCLKVPGGIFPVNIFTARLKLQDRSFVVVSRESQGNWSSYIRCQKHKKREAAIQGFFAA